MYPLWQNVTTRRQFLSKPGLAGLASTLPGSYLLLSPASPVSAGSHTPSASSPQIENRAIRPTINPTSPLRFPFQFRIPAWATGATITVDGEPQPATV